MGTVANTLRLIRRPVAAAVTLSMGLAVPVCLAATPPGSGGVGLGSGTSTSTTSTQTDVHHVNQPVSVQGDGITLSTVASGQTGAKLVFSGLAASDAGSRLEVDYRSAGKTAWHRAATTTIGPTGAFKLSWHVTASGHLGFRGVLLPASSSSVADSAQLATSASGSAPSTPSLAVTIFRAAEATFYGPGFWGHRTACGQRLTKTLIGVANRTLKCGTKVSIYYRGKEMVVPVIDRGPYGTAARWDLTEATAKALGITETVTIGALS